MTRDEIVDLLTLTAAFDQRTIGEGDIAAWLTVSVLDGWVPRHAYRAVIEYYRTATERRIMPADVTRILRDLRRCYAMTYEHRPCPPGMSEAAETAWERERIRGHITERMDAWAGDGTGRRVLR